MPSKTEVFQKVSADIMNWKAANMGVTPPYWVLDAEVFDEMHREIANSPYFVMDRVWEMNIGVAKICGVAVYRFELKP